MHRIADTGGARVRWSVGRPSGGRRAERERSKQPGARRYPMTNMTAGKPVQSLSQVIIRFAGDSGDGMQLTGDRFTTETAAFGNSLSTLPDLPAEIRAPAGTLPGVSAFQLHFADHTVVTPATPRRCWSR